MKNFDYSWIVGRADRDARVYVLYGAGHECLYVGMTSDISKRIRAHRRRQPWWSEVTAIASFECDSREDARRHEDALQELLRPTRCTTPSERREAQRLSRERKQIASAA